MDQKLIDLFDEFTHGDMGRRAFLKRLTVLAGSVAAAYTLLPLLENNYAAASVVAADDERLRTGTTEWAGGSSQVRGYFAMPAVADGPLPTVVVIHENRGLNPHIEDVTRRAALAGFLALAPDGLSSLGGTPENPDDARALFGQLDRGDSLADFIGAVDHLAGHDSGNGKVGCVGFCWGGGMANRLAANAAQLDAAVSFYGSQAPTESVPQIRAALQLHYAEHDDRINAGIVPYMTALQEAGVTFEQYIYPGTQHAFHNDTSEARYDAESATLAWRRTVDFFHRHLATQ